MTTPAGREPGKPFLWGWDDESVFFVLDDGPGAVCDHHCIQDHPDLHAAILRLCQNYFLTNDPMVRAAIAAPQGQGKPTFQRATLPQ